MSNHYLTIWHSTPDGRLRCENWEIDLWLARMADYNLHGNLVFALKNPADFVNEQFWLADNRCLTIVIRQEWQRE